MDTTIPTRAEPPAARRATVHRATRETKITLSLDLDGRGEARIATGLGFFDHMLDQLARHGLFDLTLEAEGDLHIDPHHTVEDTGLVLGQALAEALGDKRGIHRFGHAYAPMDEALVRAAVDLSGRAYLVCQLPFTTDLLGTMDSELVAEFLRAFTSTGRFNLHVEKIDGSNNHHVCEAAFKALARALKTAVALDPRATGILPSTKGAL